MKDLNNKLVPLPNPDERQRVSKEHRLTLMISNLLPVFGQVIMVMVLRCYVSGADRISPSNAIIFTLLLAAMMFESWGSLNLLAQPYIRRRPAKVLYAVVMAALVLGAVGMAIFYPFSQTIIWNEIAVSGVSIIKDYMAIYLGAFYFRLRG